MADLPTVDFNSVEIFAAGSFNGDTYTEQDLDAMVEAFDKVGFKPPIKAGHQDAQEDEKTSRRVFGEPALGYVRRIYRNGKKLLADLTKVPRRFADLIKAGSYSRISAEVYWAYSNHDGEKLPRVLKAISFLGADIPALTNLKEIEALFQRNDSGVFYAYDNEKNEFRLYEMNVVDPSPELSRYHEDPTGFTHAYEMKIVKEGDGFCLYDGDKKIGKYPTMEAAKKAMAGGDKAEMMNDDDKEMYSKRDSKTKGGHQMTEQEMEAKFNEQFAQKVAELQANAEKQAEKKYAEKIEAAKIEGKAEGESETQALRDQIKQLYMEKRSERIGNWISKMKSEGKLSPAEEQKVKSIREWIPDEEAKVQVYSIGKDNKPVKTEQSVAALFESLIESRPSIFTVVSKDGKPQDSSEDWGETVEDPNLEVDRRAQLYQKRQHQGTGKEVDYMAALTYVLKQDPQLARKYNESRQ